MQVNKTVTVQKFQELKDLIEKLRKNQKVQSFSFNGSVRKERDRKFESYSISWIEEEEIK